MTKLWLWYKTETARDRYIVKMIKLYYDTLKCDNCFKDKLNDYEKRC